MLAESDCTEVDFSRRQTRFSITGAQQLAVELAKTRERGVAFDREESLLGIGCVAAAIGLPGQPLAAVSVCGPIDRITLDQRLAAPVRITASRIWRNMEFGPHQGGSRSLQAVHRRSSVSRWATP